MALTYADAALSIEQNNWLRFRARVALSNYANFLLNTAPADPDFDEKNAIGAQIARTADSVMVTLMFTLSGDPEMQNVGPAATDLQLQSFVERMVPKFLPSSPSALGFNLSAVVPVVPRGPLPQHALPNPPADQAAIGEKKK